MLRRRLLIPTAFLLLTFLIACSNGGERYETAHDLAVALTKGGLSCDWDEEDQDRRVDGAGAFADAINDLADQIEAVEDEYDAQFGSCELDDEEQATIAVFDDEETNAEFVEEMGDAEAVYVLGGNWLVSVESIPIAEQVTDALGGSVQE